MYAIPVSAVLELPGPFERMTMGSVTRVALHEDALRAGPRLLLPAIVVEMLRWYQVCPTQVVPNA